VLGVELDTERGEQVGGGPLGGGPRRPFRAVAEELGVAPESLRRWVLQAEIDEGRKACSSCGRIILPSL
jgi:hypothetical protein